MKNATMKDNARNVHIFGGGGDFCKMKDHGI